MPGTRISDYDRGRVIGRYLSGQTISNIAKIEDRPHQTISNIIIRDIQPDGHLIPPTPPTGRPRIIRSPTRRLLLAEIDQNRHTTTKNLANDHHISRQSIYTIAASANLRSDKEELVPEIQPADERARLEWSAMRANHDFRDYLYTDEVAFTIGEHSQDTYVFRTPSERLDRSKTHARKPTF